MFIDDVDDDRLSMAAWGFATMQGPDESKPCSDEITQALARGFREGYIQARRDEKQMYDEATKLIQESQNRQRCQDLAAIFRLIQERK